MACIEITAADFDDMHHALGRPADPMVPSYRNHFCIDAGNPQGAHMLATGCWTFARTINGGNDAVYCVTQDGRSALADWLKLKRLADAEAHP